jgi:DNA-binding MarR family transcriptional regulator
MTSEVATEAPGYWYGQSRASGTDVLNALRRYRSSELGAQRRAREALGLGENALLALRMLIEADRLGRTVNAKELAEHLGITAASTSALVDRLVRSGHLERRPDPIDRRGVILTATGPEMLATQDVIEELDAIMRDAAGRLTPEDASVVIAFLDELTAEIDQS